MPSPGLQVSHADTVLAGVAACVAFSVVALPVFLVVLFGWVTTLDFYLACSALVALIVYAEEGEL
jgi:hypothetical protein